MGLLDNAGKNAGEATIDKIDQETLPELEAEAKAILAALQTVVQTLLGAPSVKDLLAGAKVTLGIEFPDQKKE